MMTNRALKGEYEKYVAFVEPDFHTFLILNDKCWEQMIHSYVPYSFCCLVPAYPTDLLPEASG